MRTGNKIMGASKLIQQTEASRKFSYCQRKSQEARQPTPSAGPGEAQGLGKPGTIKGEHRSFSPWRGTGSGVPELRAQAAKSEGETLH